MATPRTEAEWKRLEGQGITIQHKWHAEALERELNMANERYEKLRLAVAKRHEDISQTCGKALGYPWFKDDPKNFPGATEACGVCVGEHVAETIVTELANAHRNALERINRLERDIEIALNQVHELKHQSADAIEQELKAQKRIKELAYANERLQGELETGFGIIKDQQERIKRLEEAGDRLLWMAPPGLKGSKATCAKEAWFKSKEENP